MLDFLVDERGVAWQERDLVKAIALFEQGFAADPAIPDADLLWQMIDVDGINPFAWWNLAVAAEEEGDYETAVLAMVVVTADRLTGGKAIPTVNKIAPEGRPSCGGRERQGCWSANAGGLEGAG